VRVNVKALIFVIVILAVGIIFVIPYLNPGPGELSGNGGREFSLTTQPAEKLQEAKAAGRPVFLEFYAAT